MENNTTETEPAGVLSIMGKPPTEPPPLYDAAAPALANLTRAFNNAISERKIMTEKGYAVSILTGLAIAALFLSFLLFEVRSCSDDVGRRELVEECLKLNRSGCAAIMKRSGDPTTAADPLGSDRPQEPEPVIQPESEEIEPPIKENLVPSSKSRRESQEGKRDR